MDAAQVRRAWLLGEIVHDLTYFAPETRAAGGALGLRGGWMTYFGFRAAPLGAVSAATVTATFYSFAPSMVARAVPDVWRYATPEQLLHARLAAVDVAMRRVLAEWVGGNGSATGGGGGRLGRAAELAVGAAAAVEPAGRPLAAANAALAVPAVPHLALWQALTTLREHRGDGHVALLVGHGIGPIEALVLAAASGRSTAAQLRENRRWSEEEWTAAEGSLAARGWLAGDGVITAAGAAVRADLERATDELATAPYRVLGADALTELVSALRPVADRIVTSGAVPVPNPVGVTWPVD
jgi:hypothetical protein